MDLSNNTIHRTLLDASLPSTIKDLKNPTEDYVVNLLTKFLSHFRIDVSSIEQATTDQITAMPYYEDSSIVNLINLHACVAQIFDKILLQDFCLTDITSPGQKRLKKQAKFLSNFVLYAMQKQSGFNERMAEIQDKATMVEELKQRKAQVLESINNKIMHKAKQLSMIEKLEDEINSMQSKMEQINKKELESEAMKRDVEKTYQEAKERYGSVKIKAGKLFKMIADLQSEVVNSPEEYRSRLDEIEEQHKSKEKERDEMQEAIQDKKQSIKQIGEKLNLVQKATGDFCTLADIYEEQRKKKAELNTVREKLDSLNNVRDKLKVKLAMHEDQMDTEKDELQMFREKDLDPLHNLHSQLLSERKIQKTKLNENQDCLNEKLLKRNKFQADIKKIEEETTASMNNYQEIYNKEIADEYELQKIWKNNYKI